MNRNLKLIVLIYSLSLIATTSLATIRLPHIFSDNMVLQRNKPIKIWGWANSNEVVNITFLNQQRMVKADKDGNWTILLDQSPAGGPYQLEVKGKSNSIVLQNILMGDVWVCSGQSNMEMPIYGDWASVSNYEEEIRNAHHPLIRSFKVEKKMQTKPQNDSKGIWTVCSPQTVSDYSATAYFFARKLNKELNIPIGIINSSWGGTEIESWISADSFDKLSKEFKEKYDGIEIGDFDQFVKNNEANEVAYQTAMQNDKGSVEQWYIPTTDVSKWRKMQIPQAWENVLGDIDGVIWFRYSFDLPQNEDRRPATIQLGPIDDDDVLWINGVKIGETKGYTVNRKYNVPENILKEGTNTIVLKISDYSGGGGIYGHIDDLYLKTEKKTYNLAGEWQYREAVTNKEYNYKAISPNMYNSLLYNAMINPIIQLPIKGVIWYQGESNAHQAYNYRTLFPTLIKNWREKWGYDFPFYWVQLANYMRKDKQPQESQWAELREAQSLTLSLPQTAQAVTIDIGESDDIHPRNKQDVGLRLALIALNETYGVKNLISRGPTFKSISFEGNKAIIEFDNVAQGLLVDNKYRYIEGFSVAGTDKKFEWAKARLEGNNRVVIVSEKIINPVAVRFLWNNNPDINLFNSARLPASPFRTDDWEN